MPEPLLWFRSRPVATLPEPPVADDARAEVEQFVATNGLRDHLGAALLIAAEAFPPGSELTVRLQRSPELDGGRLVVNVKTRAGVQDAVGCHQQLLERWTRELPLAVQDHITATFSLA